MLLDEKSIGSASMSDIEQLVSDVICESRRLEYKSAWWGENDEARREMLRDISALANADGGYIVIGVETETGVGAGDLECPTRLAGVPRANYQERIVRSCRDNFDPPCVGIDAAQIEYGDDRAIVIVKVPRAMLVNHGTWRNRVPNPLRQNRRPTTPLQHQAFSKLMTL